MEIKRIGSQASIKGSADWFTEGRNNMFSNELLLSLASIHGKSVATLKS